ncbi:MAG: sensor histidine kinase [Chitinophagaceae bacterium]
MLKYLILIFSFSVSVFGYTQNPVYRVINNLNGLPTNTIYDIIQDDNGYIWLAHDKGLTRYDGKNYKHYINPSKQGRSLSNLLNYNSVIWCQDFAGNFYHTKHDSLIPEPKLRGKGSFTQAGIIDGELFAPSSDSIRILNLNNGSLKVKRTNIYVLPVPYFTNNEFYTAYLTGIESYRNKKLSFKSIALPQLFYLLKIGNQLYGCRRDKYPYIYKIGENKPEPINLLKDGLFIQNFCKIDDEIWVATSTGAYCFNSDFTPKYNGICFFEGSSISGIMKDREGNYWFASTNKGVYLVVNLNLRLIGKYNISALAQHNKTLLAGTLQNELYAFNGNDFTFIQKQNVNHEVVYILNDTVNNNLAIASYELMITSKNKTNFYKLAAKNVVQFAKNNYLVSYNSGGCIIGDGIGIPEWFSKQFLIWDEQNFFYKINAPQGRGRYIEWNPIDSTVYLANSAGLFYFTRKGMGEITYNNMPIYASQVKAKDKLLYIATFNDGLMIAHNNKVEQTYNQSNSLSQNTIFKFAVSNQYIWTITDKGIQRINLNSRNVSTFNYADGLPWGEIKDILPFQNQVYLATTDGLAVFNENMGSINRTPPILQFNEWLINGKKQLYISDTELTNDQNSVDIHFSVLSFRGADAITIRYKINNSEWIKIDPDARVLTLPALSSGKYLVTIQAINEDGFIAAKPLIIQFQINAPFYKRWWFLLLVLVTAVLLVFLYFKLRLKNLSIRNELIAQKLKLEQELQQSILTSIKSQMNPHFIFNALNTIQSYIYANDKDNATEYLSKFSVLTRMILEMSNKDKISLTEEIKALNLYLELEKQRFEDKLQYFIKVDEDINPDFSYIPSMLIQPYVENAVKHGLLHKKDNRMVTIEFHKSYYGILATVDDNGIGRKRSAESQKFRQQKHQSFALTANSKRLDILNKGLSSTIDIKIIDKENELGQPTGTLVQLHIPLIQNRLSSS